MANHSGGKFLFGLMIGASMGVAAVLLLAPRQGPRRRQFLIERARGVAEGVTSLSRVPDKWREHKTRRDGRRLDRRIERMRSAGY